MKLALGIDLIQTTFWGRPLNLVLVRGKKLTLIDTGIVGTPTDAVLPYLASEGLALRDLNLVVITHAHADHFGGNEELWLASNKKLRFVAHRLDKDWIENPPASTRQWAAPYVALGLMTAEELETTVRASGNGVKVGQALRGGELLRLGEGLELEIVFTPGHTPGNICVLERRSRTLIQGETVCGIGQYNVEGKLTTVPYYEDPATYVRTIGVVAGLSFRLLVPSHLPPMDRDAAYKFLNDSLTFTLSFEAEVRARLKKAEKPLAAVDMWRSMDDLWHQYPADAGLYMLLAQHLEGMLRRGVAGGTLADGVSWIGPDDDELSRAGAETRERIRRMQR